MTTALGAARADVREEPAGRVPAHLRDAHYPGAAKLGHGKGYRVPARRAVGLGRPGVPAGRGRRAGATTGRAGTAPTSACARGRRRRRPGRRATDDPGRRMKATDHDHGAGGGGAGRSPCVAALVLGHRARRAPGPGSRDVERLVGVARRDAAPRRAPCARADRATKHAPPAGRPASPRARPACQRNRRVIPFEPVTEARLRAAFGAGVRLRRVVRVGWVRTAAVHARAGRTPAGRR